MALIQKTIDEMTAGAKELARQRGESELPPGYMEAIIRTQQRRKLLTSWEKQGKITIERVVYNRIHIGSLSFDDIDAEKVGGYPSEVLIANIALALDAGQGKNS